MVVALSSVWIIVVCFCLEHGRMHKQTVREFSLNAYKYKHCPRVDSCEGVNLCSITARVQSVHEHYPTRKIELCLRRNKREKWNKCLKM